MSGRVLIGRGEHWTVLGVCGIVLWLMGTQHLHIRDFVLFILTLLGAVVLSLGFIVWRYRAGDSITRESFEDASLPHSGADDLELLSKVPGGRFPTP